MKPTFRHFLLNEDLATDVLNLQTQLSTLQAKKANQDKALDAQIIRIQNLLAQKQKQLSTQTKTTSAQQQQQQPQQQANAAQQQANAATNQAPAQ